MMVQAEARTTMAPSLFCSGLVFGALRASPECPGDYLLAVQAATIGLDRDELLAADGETVGEGVAVGGESRGQGVDVFLGELDG